MPPRRAFGIGNPIARSIEHLAAHLYEPVTIDDMAARAPMSRAVFNRRFKEATTQLPIQFVKAMHFKPRSYAGKWVMGPAKAAYRGG